MGYLGVRGARDSVLRFCRFGWERRCGPGANAEVEGERERTGLCMLSVDLAQLTEILILP